MESESVPSEAGGDTVSAGQHSSHSRHTAHRPYAWGTLDAEDLLVCALCSRYFKDPRVLKCDHTFCRECLQDYYDERQASYGTRIASMPCPCCDTRTYLPIMGVSGLPVDSRMRRAKEVFVNELIEDVRRRSSTDPEHAEEQEGVCVREPAASQAPANTDIDTSPPASLPAQLLLHDLNQAAPSEPPASLTTTECAATKTPPSPPVPVQEQLQSQAQPVDIPVPPPRRKRRSRLSRTSEVDEEAGADYSQPSPPTTQQTRISPDPVEDYIPCSSAPPCSSLPKITVEPGETPVSPHFSAMDNHRIHPDLSSSLPRSFTDPDLTFDDYKSRRDKEEPPGTRRHTPRSRAPLFEPDREFSFSGLRRSNSDRLRSKTTQELEEDLKHGRPINLENTRASKFFRRNSRRHRTKPTLAEEGPGASPSTESLPNGHARANSPSFSSSRYRTESPAFDTSHNTSYTSTESPDLGSRFTRNIGRSASFNAKYTSSTSSPFSSRFDRRQSETPTFGSSSRFDSERSETPSFSSKYEARRSETPTFESSHRSETPTFGSSHRSETPTFGSSHRSETPTFESSHRSETPTFGSSHRSETPTFGSSHRSETPTFGSSRRSATPTFESRFKRDRAETPTFGSDYGIHRSETPTFESRFSRTRSETPTFDTSSTRDHTGTPKTESYTAEYTTPKTDTYTSHEYSSTSTENIKPEVDDVDSSFGIKTETPVSRRYRSEEKEPQLTQDNNNNGIFSSPFTSSRKNSLSREEQRRKRWSYPAFTHTNSPLFDKYLRDSDDDDDDDEEEEEVKREVHDSKTKDTQVNGQSSSTEGLDQNGATANNATPTKGALSPIGENPQSFISEEQSTSPDDQPQSTDEPDMTVKDSRAGEDNGMFKLDLEDVSEETEVILEEREVEVKIEHTFNITATLETNGATEGQSEGVNGVKVEVEEDSDDGVKEEANEEEAEEGDEEEDSPEPLYQPAEQQWSVEKTEHEQPTSLALMPSGKVIVADYGHSNLQFYSDEGQLEFQVEGLKPYCMTLNKDGNVVVGDRKNKTLKIFDEFGTDIAQWPENILDWVSGIGHLSDGTIVVLDRQYCRIKLFDMDGEAKSEFCSYGTRDKQIAMADFLTVDSQDRIIVCDSGNHCIKVFDPQGKLLLKFGSRGAKRGQLQWPKGVCVDDKDNIIVADTKNNRVCMFDPQGKYIQRLVKDVPNPFAVSFTQPNQLGVTQFTLSGESDFRIYKIDEVLADLSLEESL